MGGGNTYKVRFPATLLRERSEEMMGAERRGQCFDSHYVSEIE